MPRSKRQRRRQKKQAKKNRARTAPMGSGPQKARKVESVAPTGVEQTSPGSQPGNPQYAWVAVEHRDPDGNPTLPKKLMASTYRRLYSEVPSDAEIRVLVLEGYKPKPLMLVERKIYEIHHLSVRGWRHRGQVTVEVEEWRHYEADWFNAMRGVGLQISDPSPPGLPREKSDYIVSDSSFDRKVVVQIDARGRETEVKLHEGRLDITETWRSAWRRQKTEVLSLGWKLILAPLLVALGAGLTLIWVNRTPSSQVSDSHTEGTAVQHDDQLIDGATTSEPSSAIDNGQSPDSAAPQVESDTLGG